MKMKKLIYLLVISIVTIFALGKLRQTIIEVENNTTFYTVSKEKTSNSKEQKEEKPSSNETIDQLLQEMTLEEKVGQLFLARVPEINQIEDITQYHLGGYLLFGRDFEGQTLDSITQTIQTYQDNSKYPLLIASDEEGGYVSRISSILDQPFASDQAIYQQGGMEAVQDNLINKINTLSSVGIQSGLFPIADFTEDKSSFIYPRTLGTDLETTKTYITTMVKTLKENHFMSTLKHFPGYGNNADSHTDIIRDNRSLDDLRQTDFQTFIAGIEAGADSVLVSHNILTAVDDKPSSLSPNVMSILRDQLGFQGVIMTDDMDMAGLNDFVTSQEDAAFQAIQAGADVILSSTYQTQIPYLIQKVQNNELSEDRIDESVRRILTLKYNLQLIQ